MVVTVNYLGEGRFEFKCDNNKDSHFEDFLDWFFDFVVMKFEQWVNGEWELSKKDDKIERRIDMNIDEIIKGNYEREFGSGKKRVSLKIDYTFSRKVNGQILVKWDEETTIFEDEKVLDISLETIEKELLDFFNGTGFALIGR